MWSEEQYDYERLPRERLPPRRPDDDYHRVVSFGLKKPPLLDRRAEGSYDRYEYGHAPIGYREYEEGRSFAHERSGPPHRNDEPGYRLPREEHPASRQPDYRDIRDGLRRKSIYPHYGRERSPHKRDSPYFRESPVSRRDSPHSRSGSSVSSRSYSPDRSKVYAFHQSQHSRSKERPSSHILKTSREVSPSGTTAVPPSKALDKSSRLTEKELEEAASRWAAEKDKADASIIPEIPDFDARSSEQLYEHHEETGVNTTDDTELFEDSQHASRSKAISAKTKEIEQNPIPNLHLTLEQQVLTKKCRRRSRTKAHPITWGDIKGLTSKAQRQLQLAGETETTEKLLVAMLAEITKNSLPVGSLTPAGLSK